MFGLGMQELVIILVIALIIFGPRKLPELGRSLGKSIGEFKRASSELRNTIEDEIRVEETKTTATPAPPAATSAPAVGRRACAGATRRVTSRNPSPPAQRTRGAGVMVAPPRDPR